MKKYEISSASKFKEAILLMKDPVEARKAQSVATVWSVMERKGIQVHLRVCIELGRSAVLVRYTPNDSIILGDMHLNRAREFVKGLVECNEKPQAVVPDHGAR